MKLASTSVHIQSGYPVNINDIHDNSNHCWNILYSQVNLTKHYIYFNWCRGWQPWYSLCHRDWMEFIWCYIIKVFSCMYDNLISYYSVPTQTISDHNICQWLMVAFTTMTLALIKVLRLYGLYQHMYTTLTFLILCIVMLLIHLVNVLNEHCLNLNLYLKLIRTVEFHFNMVQKNSTLHAYKSNNMAVDVLIKLTSILVWISNYIHYKIWDEITYPFPNFSGFTVEVWEWISYFISHSILYVISYPCWASAAMVLM